MVEDLEAEMFVPAHADASDDIRELVRFNREKVYDISAEIQDILKKPMCFEELLKHLFDKFGLTMNFEQYVLVGSTVRSYLSWLKDNKKINAVFKDNLLIWNSL